MSVLTGDPEVEAAAHSLGVATLREPPTTNSLNGALAWALEELARTESAAVLILQADLPALTGPELATFTRSESAANRIFVADQHGTGTTALLLRTMSDSFRPQFGPNSAERHRRAGAQLAYGQWPGLRHDVDTADDLDAAVALGVGPATADALAACAKVPGRT